MHTIYTTYTIHTIHTIPHYTTLYHTIHTIHTIPHYTQMIHSVSSMSPLNNLRGSPSILHSNNIHPAVATAIIPSPRNHFSAEGAINNDNHIHIYERLESTMSGVLKFEGWKDPNFQAMFLLSSIMGCILNYSIFLCTTVNSALTTAVIGALKNIAVTYVGMLAFSDYNFSWVNFIGINISILGSLYYTYVTIFKGQGR